MKQVDKSQDDIEKGPFRKRLYFRLLEDPTLAKQLT